jgi:hypothetical protein
LTLPSTGPRNFQTLLALAQEQLWTTHDKKKLKLLAAALANSGTELFRNDDKELMVRALRAVSPSDFETLNHQNLKGWLPLTKRIEYGPDVLGSLSRLASQGLVIEMFLPQPEHHQRTEARFRRRARDLAHVSAIPVRRAFPQVCGVGSS